MADEILSPEDMPSSPINPNASSNSVNSLGQSVIPVVNKLQDIFAQLGSSSTIDLPQVAVVGSQSSGKSSVLEALVGRDFLPRGSDICTRRPLVLQLVQTPRRTDGSEISEWGEFLHLPGKRFTDFSAIRKEIQAETEREVGVNKGVSDKQIRLKIYSPNVLNITLVDLPGITKVPVGDQPTDIEARIRTMIMSYIKHETCIILAVSPANADLSNSDALQMARVADADGHRTIGVITKLDIMDRGTDATNFLLGNVIPLRLGYVGVVNRSQADINGNKSIQDALAYEEKFFRSRPVYHRLADRCGIPQLAKKLNHILVQHIRAILPGLKARINAQMVSVVKEISTLGGEITESRASQGVLLLNILTKYSEAFTSVVEGKNEEMSTAELSGGARIHYIFQSIYVKCLELVDPCDDLTDDDIRTAIQNATGPRNALFVPEVPFEVLVRRQIARLLDPSIQCARFIYDELLKIAHRCKALELERFPVLRRRLDEIVGNFLREGLSPAERMIEHLIEMEMDYINTSHPAFIGGSKAVEVAWQQQKSKSTIPMVKTKDGADSERIPAADKSQKSRAIFARSTPSSAVADSSSRPMATYEKAVSGGISSIFGSSESRTFAKDSVPNNTHNESANGVESMLSMIQLREPPAVLRPAELLTENESVEITVTKLLLKSYYDIVRKNVQDFVPKAIMHFLVNYAKRDLHGILIKKLYRENLFEEVLQEREEIAIRRKRNRELLRVLQQAVWTLDELPLESDVPSRMSNFAMDSTGLPRASALTPSIYGMVNGDYGGVGSYVGSPTRTKSRKSPHSGEQPLPLHSSAAANGSGQSSAIGASYPTINP